MKKPEARRQATPAPLVPGGLIPFPRRATPYMCIVLPFPPSTNTLFPGKARRFKSGAYKDWIERAGWALCQQFRDEGQDTTHFGNPVKETISLGRPDRHVRDLANFEKAINDLLVAHSILRDDSLIHDLRLKWDDKIIGAIVEIEEL